jgi:hypothetical protein
VFLWRSAVHRDTKVPMMKISSVAFTCMFQRRCGQDAGLSTLPQTSDHPDVKGERPRAES